MGKGQNVFFLQKKKDKLVKKGPGIDDKENLKKFKDKHKSTFIKNRVIYSKEKPNLKLGKFIEAWREKNKKHMEDMNITDLKILEDY